MAGSISTIVSTDVLLYMPCPDPAFRLSGSEEGLLLIKVKTFALSERLKSSTCLKYISVPAARAIFPLRTGLATGPFIDNFESIKISP
jgi:hypothetical protein